MINYDDLKTDADWETHQMIKNGFSIRIEFPYFNMYVYEIDTPMIMFLIFIYQYSMRIYGKILIRIGYLIQKIII